MEMTIEQKRALALAAARRRRAAAPVPEVMPEAAPEPSLSENVQGLGQRLLKGQTLGFGDEIAGFGRAALEGIPGEGEQSFGDKYRMYRDDARAVDTRFAENNPKTAFTAELVGGIASPVSKIAPGLGATGGAGARLGQAVARGSAEGAVYGFGEGTGSLEDQWASAAVGGATGGVTSGLLTGGGGLLGRALSKRRVDESLLQPDGSFKPIHLADQEGGIGEFYRSTVGAIPYAKGALQAQEKPFIDAAEQKVDDFATTVRSKEDDIQDAYANRVDQVRAEKESALPAAKKMREQQAAQEAFRFRQQAYSQSLPEHGRTALDGVDISSPRKAEEAISNWWTNNGFEEVKSNKFDWDSNVDTGLIQSIRTKLSEDPDLAIEAYKAIPGLEAMVQKLRLSGGTGKGMAPADYVNQMLATSQTVGINGDALMAIRNQFAKAANKNSTGRAPRAIANEIDDLIRTQLGAKDPSLVKQFDDQLGQYTTALTLKNVLRKKSVRERGGDFEPADWLGVSGKYGGKGMSLKEPPQEAAALASNSVVKSLKDTTKIKQDIRNRSAQQLKQARLEKTLRKRLLADQKKHGPLAKAKTELANLNRAKTPVKVSPWSALASTAILGAPAVLGSGFGVLPAGLGAAKLLSTQKGQTLMAGQTNTQRRLAEALRRGDTAKYTQILSRMAAGQAAGE